MIYNNNKIKKISVIKYHKKYLKESKSPRGI